MWLSRVLRLLDRVQAPDTVQAHCDVPCGVYDPEQARIEAESCMKVMQKFQDASDKDFLERCITVKEERAELAKHHLSVLWSDHFKPKHLDEMPHVHDVFWNALKQCSQLKRTMDPAEAQTLLDMIDEIDVMWKQTDGPSTTRVNGRPA